jgi:hypothetical protein
MLAPPTKRGSRSFLLIANAIRAAGQRDRLRSVTSLRTAFIRPSHRLREQSVVLFRPSKRMQFRANNQDRRAALQCHQTDGSVQRDVSFSVSPGAHSTRAVRNLDYEHRDNSYHHRPSSVIWRRRLLVFATQVKRKPSRRAQFHSEQNGRR